MDRQKGREEVINDMPPKKDAQGTPQGMVTGPGGKTRPKLAPQHIERLRVQSGLDKRELASKAHVSPNFYYRILKGQDVRRANVVKVLGAISEALGIDPPLVPSEVEGLNIIPEVGDQFLD